MTRSVETIFTAKVDGYLANVTRMKAATADMAKSGAANMKAHGADWDKIGKASTVAGLAIGAAVVYSAKKYMDFEAAMSKVGAVANSTAKEQKALGEAALKAGQDTVFSATQAAEAEAELLKAGISVSDVLGGALTGSLNLAAAGQIGLAQSAEIAAQAMNIFNLEGADVGHIADVLTAGANKSAAGVDDLGMALAQGGLVAKQTGLTLEETVGTLSAFADNALKGSDAGTSMKTMLQRLNPTTTEAKTLMEQLNLSAYDSQGNFVGLAEYAGQLQRALSGMTVEQRNATLATLFGSDAVRGANVLYEQGEAGMRKYIAAVDDQGAAARMAARQTDNLKGDIERLKGTLETAFIKGGSGANEGLRELVQGLESLVERFNSLSPATQSYIVKAAAVAAGMLLLGAGVIKAVSAVQSLKAAYVATGIAGSRFATTTGVATKGVAKLAAAFAVLAVASQFGGSDEFGVNALAKDLRAAEDPLKAINAELERTAVVANGSDFPIRNIGDALKEAFDPGAFNGVQKVIGGIANAFGGDFKTDSQFAAIQLDRVGQSLAKLVQDGKAEEAAAAFAEISAQAKAQGISTEDLLRKMPAYQDALDSAAASATAAGGATGELADETAGAGKAAEAAAEAITGAVDAIKAFGSAASASRSAESEFQAAIDDASASIKENGRTLDLRTEKGRANDAALRTLADTTKAAAAETFNMSGSMDAATAKMEEGRAAFIKNAIAAGLNAEGAAALADQLGLIPAETKAVIKQTGAVEATAEVASLKDTIFRLDGKVVTVKEEGADPSKGRVVKLDGTIFGLKGKTVEVKEIGANAAGERVVSFKGKIFVLKGKTVAVTETGANASAARVEGLRSRIAGLQSKTVRVNVMTAYSTTGSVYRSQVPSVRRAGGGPVFGPGTTTSDSIPALLSNDEHVLTASDVRKAGGHDAIYRMREAIQAGAARFAHGGAVKAGGYASGGAVAGRSWAEQVRGLAPRSVGMGGTSVTNLVNVTITDALDPVAVGAQVERALQDYTSVTGRPLQVVTR